MSAPELVPLDLCPGSYTWAGIPTGDSTAACPACGGVFVPGNPWEMGVGAIKPDEGPRSAVQTPAHVAVGPPPADTMAGEAPEDPRAATEAAARAIGLAPRAPYDLLGEIPPRDAMGKSIWGPDVVDLP